MSVANLMQRILYRFQSLPWGWSGENPQRPPNLNAQIGEASQAGQLAVANLPRSTRLGRLAAANSIRPTRHATPR